MEDDDPYSELDMEERAYVGLHDAMMKMYQNEDRQAFRISAQLLTVWTYGPYRLTCPIYIHPS